MQNHLFKYTLRLADTSLILAQRRASGQATVRFWRRPCPTNITLDIFGRAKALLEYAAKQKTKTEAKTTGVYAQRARVLQPAYYRTAKRRLCKTILRQAFIDCFDLMFYTELAKAGIIHYAGIAAKSVKEISYHKRHSFSWVLRFGNGTEESKRRSQEGFDALWQFTGEMFEMNDTDEVLIKEGIAVNLAPLRPAGTLKFMNYFKGRY